MPEKQRNVARCPGQCHLQEQNRNAQSSGNDQGGHSIHCRRCLQGLREIRSRHHLQSLRLIFHKNKVQKVLSMWLQLPKKIKPYRTRNYSWVYFLFSKQSFLLTIVGSSYKHQHLKARSRKTWINKHLVSQWWCCRSVIPALGKQRYKQDQGFKISIRYEENLGSAWATWNPISKNI